MQHFHPTPAGGNFCYRQDGSAPKPRGPDNLKLFFSFLDSLGSKFLPNASIIPPKAGQQRRRALCPRVPRREYVGKVALTAAIHLDKLDELMSFASGQAGSGMLIAARSGKLFVIDRSFRAQLLVDYFKPDLLPLPTNAATSFRPNGSAAMKFTPLSAKKGTCPGATGARCRRGASGMCLSAPRCKGASSLRTRSWSQTSSARADERVLYHHVALNPLPAEQATRTRSGMPLSRLQARRGWRFSLFLFSLFSLHLPCVKTSAKR